jgi:anti-anti-sigma regulatory factor
VYDVQEERAMTGRMTWTTSEAPPTPPRAVGGCSVRSHTIPFLGRVVKVVLSGRQDPAFWQTVRDVLAEEIPERSPDYLVFDLRGLDCIVGSAMLGGLLAGAEEMRRAGRPEGTRIVATGEIATRLAAALSLCRLDPILGAVHEDVASAARSFATPLRH